MSKSIKLKNDTYLDSTSIVHDQEKLKNILDELIPDLEAYRIKRYTLSGVSLIAGMNTIEKPSNISDTLRVINVVAYRGGNTCNANYTSFNSRHIHIYSDAAYSNVTLYIFHVDNIING